LFARNSCTKFRVFRSLVRCLFLPYSDGLTNPLGGVMFKLKKSAQTEPKDIRLSVPAELWGALELVAKREGVEWQEVARQAMAHSLRSEIKEVRKAGADEIGKDQSGKAGD
jgi:hypothetical protein